MKNFINIGLVALRNEKGELLEPRPIYISPDDGNVTHDEIKHLALQLAITHKAQAKAVAK